MSHEYKKIGEVELVIGLVFLFGLYLMDDALDGLVIGLFLVPIINGLCTLINWWFFTSKGDKTASEPKSLLLQFLVDAFPFIPGPIVTFAIKAYMHNRSEPAPAESKVVGRIGPAEGKINTKQAA